MFEINTRLMCICDKFPDEIIELYDRLPVSGEIYTTRDIVRGVEVNGNLTCAVLLNEIANTPNKHGIEHSFSPSRFVEIEDLAFESVSINSSNLKSEN